MVPFSFIRTITVGPGVTPDLLTLPDKPEGARGLVRLTALTAGGDFHPALRTKATRFPVAGQNNRGALRLMSSSPRRPGTQARNSVESTPDPALHLHYKAYTRRLIQHEICTMADAPKCPECGIEIRLTASMMIRMGDGDADWAAKCKDATAVQAGVQRKCAYASTVLAALAARQT
jgi:hypothetical protein